MKLHRLIPLTCSVALAAALTACGGGGETGPQWAQDTKKTLAQDVAYNIQTYAIPCEDIIGGFYSNASVLVTYQTAEGNFEQLQQNWYTGPNCVGSNLDLVVKYPTSKVTANGTFVDPDLGLTTTRQTKANVGGEMVLVKVGPSVTFTREEDQLGFFYDVTLSPAPGVTGAANFAVPTPLEPSEQQDVAAYQGDTLYWGDGNGTLDSNGFPTTLARDPVQVFTRIPNSAPNAPALP
jgi:hypothetical protein